MPPARSIIHLQAETALRTGPAVNDPESSLIPLRQNVAFTAEAVQNAVGDSTTQSLTTHPSESRVAQSDVLPTKRKRGKLNEGTRQKVKRVRKLGACVRCRVYHESVTFFPTCRRFLAQGLTLLV